MGTVSNIKRRGLKPGQRHSGSFAAGYDPRRYVPSDERVKVRKQVEELAREHSEAAVNFLADLLGDDKAPTKERRAAAEELLNRAWGTPCGRLAIAQVGGGQSVHNMSLEELMQRAGSLLEHQAGTMIEGDADVIETED